MRTTLAVLLALLSPVALAHPFSGAPGQAGLLDLTTDDAVNAALIAEYSADERWQTRLNAQVVGALMADPVTAQRVLDEPVAINRAGLPRLAGAHFRTPDAAPLMLHRYFAGADVSTRWAIAEMLPRTQGDWGEAVAATWQDEPHSGVRSVLVEGIRHAGPELAIPVLRAALADDAAEVRAGAVRGAGWLDEGAQLEAELVVAMGDSDAQVRAFAARAAGWKGLSTSWNELVRLLSDDDALVRLNTLRALQRIDAERAAASPHIARLVGDSDDKVARAATQITGG